MQKSTLWGGVGVAAVSLMWLVSAMANGWAGYHLSDNPELGGVLAAASVATDVMKAVSVFALASLIAGRRWFAVSIAVVVFLVCAAWSLRSATHFAATVFTTSVAKHAHAAKMQGTAEELLNIKKKRAEFLTQQTVDIEVNNKSKGRAVEMASEENRRLSREFKELMADLEADRRSIEQMGAQSAGDPLAGLFHVADKDVILATSLSFAAILEIVSGLGFWLLAQARLTRAEQPVKSRPLKPVTQALSPAPTPPVVPGPGKPVLGPMTPTFGTGGFGEPVASAPKVDTGKSGNVITLPTTNRRERALQTALEDLLQPGVAADRMLLSILTSRVNARLEAGIEPLQSRVVVEAVEALPWGAKRVRAGGQTWVSGIRERTDSVNAQSVRTTV
jgi:hypothetical protein